MRMPDWIPVAGFPALEDNQVHIWRLIHAPHQRKVSGYLPFLSTEEWSRADRLIHPHVRAAFILTRGVLRILISRYLDIPPGEVRLEVDSSGKPHLAQPSLEEIVHFNTSHTRGLSLYIFTRSRPVGIDVEEIHPAAEYTSIMQNFFPPVETRLIAALPEDQRRSAFYALWTQKESLAKAIGIGIASGLVGQALGGNERLPDAELITNVGGTRWRVWNFLPGPGFSAAAAVQENEWQVNYLDFCTQ